MFEIEEVEFSEELYKQNLEENEFSEEEINGKGMNEDAIDEG